MINRVYNYYLMEILVGCKKHDSGLGQRRVFQWIVITIFHKQFVKAFSA